MKVIPLGKGRAANPELEARAEYSTGAFSEQNKNLAKLLRQVMISIAKATQALQEQTQGAWCPQPGGSNLSPGETAKLSLD